jgi:hypothetical protein
VVDRNAREQGVSHSVKVVADDGFVACHVVPCRWCFRVATNVLLLAGRRNTAPEDSSVRAECPIYHLMQCHDRYMLI